jgi:hypothetical protein
MEDLGEQPTPDLGQLALRGIISAASLASRGDTLV